MKRLFSISLFCCVLIISAFFLFGGTEKWVTVNLHSGQSKLAYALVSFSFLSSDIILPIPSSLIMVLNGKVLGIFSGTLVSLFSGLLSSCIGFFIGRKANPYLNKFFSKKEIEMSNGLFDKFGHTSITISKALPILSEVISVVAGTTGVTFTTFLTYSITGHLIVSLIYAYIGSLSTTVNSNIVAGVIIVSALLIGWLIQFLITRSNARSSTIPGDKS